MVANKRLARRERLVFITLKSYKLEFAYAME